MSKIEEIINHYVPPVCQGEWYEKMMIEYAEWYAKKCLEIASEAATADFECIGAVLGAENVRPFVEKASITKIKFPSHDDEA